MRALAVLTLLALAGCGSTVSTVPPKPTVAGLPYVLPKGLVPIQVFADASGIGLIIEPARFAVDGEPGTLVAELAPSPFNNEDIKLAVDPVTGFLTSLTSNSDAQLLAIIEEAAKTTGRLAFQNARAAFLATKVVVFEDSLDPMQPDDVARINRGLNAAFQRASQAFISAKGGTLTVAPVTISVVETSGRPVTAPPPPVDVSACNLGICARTLTSRLIRVELGGAPLASKVVTIPSREVIAVPVPSTILANQDITIGIKDGIVEKYDLKRDSEVLGLVKLPGAALNGLFAGITQGLTERKSVFDKRKELAESEEALAKAKAERAKSAASVGETSVDLQNATADGSRMTSYSAATLTIYPFSETLTAAIQERIKAVEAQKQPPAAPRGGRDSDLLDPPSPSNR